MASIAAGQVVTIKYSRLLSKEVDLSEKLEQGFGRSGLGIIAVSEVPGYPELRSRLLLLAERVASLPEEEKRQLEDPESRYSFGWSHGKEILESGRPDILKGSFYANPLVDEPTKDKHLKKRYPSYCRPNLWPKSRLPELESTFKQAGRLIFDVGLQLAYHCDKYFSVRSPHEQHWYLQRSLQQSRCHKGRLLHYFPAPASADAQSPERISSWCGWHIDHGSLTGLTCALYTKDGLEVPCPDAEAGLYIKNAAGNIVKAEYGKNDIAFQMGEATEVLSGGLYHATPHCVKAAQGELAAGVSRNTFALFLQPQWDEPMQPPHLRGQDQAPEQASNVLNFGEFSERTLSDHYM